MRCSICGAKLKKEGDVCSNCYQEFQEDEELKKDVKEVLKVKRKYLIKYEILRYIEIIIVFSLCLLGLLGSKSFLEFLGTALLFAVVMGFLLFWDKRVANGTTATFYEKKAVYEFKFLLFNTTKVVKYKDIKDVAIYQTRRQKRLGMGDICIYPGMTLINGFQIKDVENVNETLQQIKEVIGFKEN